MLSKIRPQLVSMRRYSSAYSKHLLASTSSPQPYIKSLLMKC